MAINKNQRALVLISDLTNLPPEKDLLYNFIENSGRTVCSTILQNQYIEYVTLFDNAATKNNLINKLKNIGAKPQIKVIDLIVMLHGSNNRLGFKNGNTDTNMLSQEIKSLNLKNKLRLIYSTACYGMTHNDDWINAGFTTSIGSRKVNANASVEFPVLLQLWAAGFKIKDALAAGENPLTRIPADQAARIFASLNNLSYRNSIDSDKVLAGNSQIKISTNA